MIVTTIIITVIRILGEERSGREELQIILALDKCAYNRLVDKAGTLAKHEGDLFVRQATRVKEVTRYKYDSTVFSPVLSPLGAVRSIRQG